MVRKGGNLRSLADCKMIKKNCKQTVVTEQCFHCTVVNCLFSNKASLQPGRYDQCLHFSNVFLNFQFPYQLDILKAIKILSLC